MITSSLILYFSQSTDILGHLLDVLYNLMARGDHSVG